MLGLGSGKGGMGGKGGTADVGRSRDSVRSEIGGEGGGSNAQLEGVGSMERDGMGIHMNVPVSVFDQESVDRGWGNNRTMPMPWED